MRFDILLLITAQILKQIRSYDSINKDECTISKDLISEFTKFLMNTKINKSSETILETPKDTQGQLINKYEGKSCLELYTMIRKLSVNRQLNKKILDHFKTNCIDPAIEIAGEDDKKCLRRLKIAIDKLNQRSN